MPQPWIPSAPPRRDSLLRWSAAVAAALLFAAVCEPLWATDGVAAQTAAPAGTPAAVVANNR